MQDLYKADIVFEQVETPLNGWCDSGHKAPDVFKQAGAVSEEPTRFFFVKSKEIKGIWCEPCLIVANHIAQCKKKGLIKA